MVCLLDVKLRVALTSGLGSAGSAVPTIHRKTPAAIVSAVVRLPRGHAQNGTFDTKGESQTSKEDVDIVSS